MTTNSDITLKIAKIVSAMVRDGTVIDIDAVYIRLVQEHGSEIFRFEHMLAQGTLRNKIRAHLKNANFSGRGTSDAQLSLLTDQLPALLSLKLEDGGHVYVPLGTADIHQIESVTAAKIANIENAKRSLEAWNNTITPVLAIMKEKGLDFGAAMAIHLAQLSIAVEVQDNRKSEHKDLALHTAQAGN